MSQPGRQKAAIIGSGNIGTDLLMKMLESRVLSPAMLVGIDPNSDGLARARELGVATTHQGIQGLIENDVFDDVSVVFDATSAKAHLGHATRLKELEKQVVDLTPAAVGPYVVPVVNLKEHLDAPNVNMVTCGGQATIPIVHAVSRVAPVKYGEIVASISSRSAGPGTRANIDEFTETTARGIEVIGGAERGKAIIVLNPADPPLLMRNTVFALTETDDEAAVTRSIEEMVADVAEYVPGYRMVQPPQFDHHFEKPLNTSDGQWRGMQVSVFLEVEGAGDWLPSYAGNLDIMTSAALKVGELLAQRERGLS